MVYATASSHDEGAHPALWAAEGGLGWGIPVRPPLYPYLGAPGLARSWAWDGWVAAVLAHPRLVGFAAAALADWAVVVGVAVADAGEVAADAVARAIRLWPAASARATLVLFPVVGAPGWCAHVTTCHGGLPWVDDCVAGRAELFPLVPVAAELASAACAPSRRCRRGGGAVEAWYEAAHRCRRVVLPAPDQGGLAVGVCSLLNTAAPLIPLGLPGI